MLPELFVLRSWNPHYELRAFALALTMSFDRRAVQFDQILNHRESDAQATLMNVCRHFTLEKYIEDVREVSSSYSHAAVSNAHDLPSRLLKKSPDDRAVFGRELDRIRHEIVRYLAQSFAVYVRVDRVRRQFELYVEGLQINLCLVRLRGVLHALSQIDQ